MPVIEQIKGWWLYVSFCFSSDYTSADCKSYWNWVAYGAFALAGLIAFLVGWSLLREYSAFWRGRMHLQARTVAVPDEVIAAATRSREARDGDPHGLDSPEYAEKFRQALETRKAELRNSGSAPTAK